MKRSEVILLKGQTELEKELDIIQILGTIHKLKAGLAAVISQQNKD